MLVHKYVMISSLCPQTTLFMCFKFFFCPPSLLDVLQIGPLRCWPGRLCLSRCIEHLDVEELIVLVPYIYEVKVKGHKYPSGFSLGENCMK